MSTRTCQYPIGTPKTPGFRFCEVPVGPGTVYCLAHERVCWTGRRGAIHRP